MMDLAPAEGPLKGDHQGWRTEKTQTIRSRCVGVALRLVSVLSGGDQRQQI